MDRPIRAILLAYHAFGNVLLFYKRCLESGVIELKDCEAIQGVILRRVKKLEEALCSTSALTEAGKIIWERLSVRISQPA